MQSASWIRHVSVLTAGSNSILKTQILEVTFLGYESRQKPKPSTAATPSPQHKYMLNNLTSAELQCHQLGTRAENICPLLFVSKWRMDNDIKKS